MDDLFVNQTSEYKIKKMVTNMPLQYIEHLERRAKNMMLHTSEVVRHCLRPDIVDQILGFTNDIEDRKVDDNISHNHESGFGRFIKGRSKFWRSW